MGELLANIVEELSCVLWGMLQKRTIEMHTYASRESVAPRKNANFIVWLVFLVTVAFKKRKPLHSPHGMNL